MKRLVIAFVTALAAIGMVAPPAQANTPRFPHVPNQVLVKFRDGTTGIEQERARQSISGVKLDRVRDRLDGTSDIELTSFPAGRNINDVIARLQADPSVEYAEPNWIYTHTAVSNDPFFVNGQLWGMYGAGTVPANQFGSNAAAAWAAGQTGSRNVIVAVIDEGVQVNHPDLQANIWVNPFDPVNGRDDDGNGYVDDTNGWDFANNNNSVYDGGTRGRADTHGTHVAGTIGAVGGNGVGVVGVSWQVTIISAKFLGTSGGTTANAIRAVDYITDLKRRHGLNIVATNNSWGGGGFSQGLLDAINRGGNAGILFVAAAGNSNNNNDATPFYPASYQCTANGTYDCVISVAAIDGSGFRASFSNYGATRVDLGAPGVSINSTLPFNTYGAYSGTSMASPHVAGAVALYAAARPGASAAQIRNAILSSAVPTPSLNGITVTGGRLDANAALSR